MSKEGATSSMAQHIRGQAGLLDCVDALRDWRAGALLLGAFVAAALLSSFGIWLASQAGAWLGFVFGLAAFAMLFYGVNAAGQMLWHAQQGTRLTMQQSVARSLATSHRLIGVFLLALGAYLVGALVFALLFWMTKLPVLGAALMLVLFPVTVVVSGVAVVAIYAVVLPLSAPAVWSGAGAVAALAQLFVIARARIVVVLLMMVVVGFITAVVAAIVFGIMMIGTLFAGGLAAASSVSIGGSTGFFGADGAGLGKILGGTLGAGGLTVAAAGVGGAIVWSMALVAPVLVYLRGCCAVYSANAEGMDFTAAQDAVAARLAAAKETARAKLAAAQAAPIATAPAASSASMDVAASPNTVAGRTDDDATVFTPRTTTAPQTAPAAPKSVESAFDAAATVGPNSPIPAAAPAVRAPIVPVGMPSTAVDLAIDTPLDASKTQPARQGSLDLALDLGAIRDDDATIIAPRSVTPSPPPPAVRDHDATVLLIDRPEGAAFEPTQQQTKGQASAHQCPVCHAPVGAEDRFCCNCGHKLR